MKMTIAWHEECLENQRASLARYQADARRAVAEAERCYKSIMEYEAKITAAKAKGMDGFDPERFGKKRG